MTSFCMLLRKGSTVLSRCCSSHCVGDKRVIPERKKAPVFMQEILDLGGGNTSPTPARKHPAWVAIGFPPQLDWPGRVRDPNAKVFGMPTELPQWRVVSRYGSTGTR